MCSPLVWILSAYSAERILKELFIENSSKTRWELPWKESANNWDEKIMKKDVCTQIIYTQQTVDNAAFQCQRDGIIASWQKSKFACIFT